MRDVVMRCRCNKKVNPVKKGDEFHADCPKCGVHASSTSQLKLRSIWRQKFGCTASYEDKSKWFAKNAENAKKKEIEPGSIEEFAERVSVETRKRLLDDNRKESVTSHGIPFAVYSINDEQLDKASEIKISVSENEKFSVVRIGPVKTFLVRISTGEIFSKNLREAYGDLTTTDDWDWSGFYVCKKDAIWHNRGVSTGTVASNNKRNIVR